MKRFPVIFAILFSLGALLLTFLGFTVVPVLMICTATVVYSVCAGVYNFVICSALWAAGVYFIYGYDINATLCMCSLTLPVALIITICFKLKTNLATMLTAATLAETAAGGFWVYNLAAKSGQTAAELLAAPFADAAKQLEALYGAGTDIQEMLISVLDLIFPSLLITTALLVVYTVFGLSRVFLRKMGCEYRHMPEFDELHMNKSQAVVFIILFVFSMFMGAYSPVLYNVMTIVSTLLMVCGLSVIYYYMKKMGMPVFLRVFICVVAITFLSTFLTPVLCMIGVWDSFKPLRKNIFII